MEKEDKGSTLIRIGVSGESSFWYRPTRVVVVVVVVVVCVAVNLTAFQQQLKFNVEYRSTGPTGPCLASASVLTCNSALSTSH